MAKLSCDICGGSLIFAGDLDTLICETCGVRYSKEAIGLKLKNNCVNSLSASVVDSEKDKIVVLAEDYVTTMQYSKALHAYLELIDKYPTDYDLYKRYLYLSVNYFIQSFDNFISVLNLFKRISHSDSEIREYIDTLYHNIVNKNDFSSFNLFNFVYYTDYSEFKKDLIKKLRTIFTDEQVNNIIKIGELNSYAFSSVKIKSKSNYKGFCKFLIGDFSFLFESVSHQNGLDFYNKKVLTQIAEINKNCLDGKCIYCGAKTIGVQFVITKCFACRKTYKYAEVCSIIKDLESKLFDY